MATITLKKEEYSRLKKLDKSFGQLFDYFAYLYDIAKARSDVKKRRTMPQEKLFKRLGL